MRELEVEGSYMGFFFFLAKYMVNVLHIFFIFYETLRSSKMKLSKTSNISYINIFRDFRWIQDIPLFSYKIFFLIHLKKGFSFMGINDVEEVSGFYGNPL